ncbi:MAG: type IV secretory system conjugative DNA transfer family protein, partial [Blastocatellia bacterium]
MSREVVKGVAFFLFLGLIALLVGLELEPNDPKFLGALGFSVVIVIGLFVNSRSVLPESDLHGSATWAKDSDLEPFISNSNVKPEQGALILGPAPNDPNKRVDLPNHLMLRHTMVLGPSGVGKGRGFFLWQLPNFNGSFVYADPKGEGWAISSGYRQHSRRYAPREPDNSFCFNWIPLCGKDAHLCLSLAKALILSSGGSGSAEAEFWIETGSYFLAAVFAHTSTFSCPTPAAAYDLVTTIKGEDLTDLLLNSPNLIAKQYGTLFSATEPKLRGNIMIGATAKLIWLADEKVRRFTSASLEPPDFGELRKKNVAVYWVLSEQDVAVLKSLSTLFFTLVLHQIKEAEGNIPVCLLLDEAANIGRIPNLEVEISVIRGRNIGLVLGLQSLAQLENVYGQAAGKIIADNCNSKIVLAGLDFKSADYLSKTLGKTTISEVATSKSRQAGLFGFGKEQISEQTVKTGRDLMTADEVRRLGDYEQIIIIANKLPIHSNRYWFTVKGKSTKPNKLGQALTVNIESPQKAEKPNSFNGRNNNQRNNNQGNFRQNNYSNQSNQNSQSNQNNYSNQSKAVKEYRPQSFNQYKK